jgi:magnesium transporter
VIEVQRATQPLLDIAALGRGFDKYHVDIELQRHLRDVQDHLLRIVEHADAFRALLQNALTVNATLVGQRQNDEIKRLTQTSLDQNEQVKRISAWAAILFAPTLLGTIYGMNFKHMPELGWELGYPFALLAMAAWESCYTSSSSAAAGSSDAQSTLRVWRPSRIGEPVYMSQALGH